METDKHSLSFGQYLQAVRLRKGVSIDAVSRETRVGLDILRAIEKEDPEGLPADVYVKGFLRAFAKVVDADGDEAVRRFDAWRRDKTETTEAEARPANPGAGHWSRVIMALGGFIGIIALTFFLFSFLYLRPPRDDLPGAPAPRTAGSEISEDAETSREPSSPVGASTEAKSIQPDDDEKPSDAEAEEPLDDPVRAQPDVVVVDRLDAAAEDPPDEPAREQPGDAVEEQPNAGAAGPSDMPAEDRSRDSGQAQPTPTSSRTDEGEAGSPPVAASEKLSLVVTTTEDTWMKVIIDGVSPREYSLKPGQTMTLEASSNFNLLIGNAGGVQLSLNDAPVNIPKKSGQVVTLQLP